MGVGTNSRSTAVCEIARENKAPQRIALRYTDYTTEDCLRPTLRQSPSFEES
jgi:hypothetical protein